MIIGLVVLLWLMRDLWNYDCLEVGGVIVEEFFEFFLRLDCLCFRILDVDDLGWRGFIVLKK